MNQSTSTTQVGVVEVDCLHLNTQLAGIRLRCMRCPMTGQVAASTGWTGYESALAVVPGIGNRILHIEIDQVELFAAM
jgi:hypothetical protein